MHWLLVYFYVFDVSFVLALLFTPLFKRLSIQWNYVDQPDQERKIHTEAMPLLGGAAVFCAFAANVVFNYLFLLPLASRVDLPFMDMPDVKMYLDGAFSVYEADRASRDCVVGSAGGDSGHGFHSQHIRELRADSVVDCDHHQRDELSR